MTTAALSLLIFGIFIVLFVWDKLPMATSAILGCVVMALFGICKFSTAFGQFASTTVIMLIGVLIVGAALSETGISSIVGQFLLKISSNSERKLIVYAFFSAALLSTFMTNVTVLAIYIPIMFALARDKKSINPMNLVIPITLAVNVGGISTLVGSSQQMTAQGLLEEYGYVGFKVFDLTPFGLILAVVSLAYVLLVGYPLGKKIWGSRELDSKYVDAEIAEVKVEKKKAIPMSVIFVIMVILYIAQKIPFTNITMEPVKTSTLAALACIITGCISQDKAIKSVNWNIVGRLGACLGLAKALDEAGGITLVSDWFMANIGAGLSPFALFALMVFAAQVLSLVISNSTAISVTLLVIMSIAPILNLNVPAFAMGIVLSSSMGACCPLSGSTWGISMAAGYQFRDYFKYGVALDLLAYVAIIISVPLMMGLTV